MKRILSYSSNREHYFADACIIACIDDRFTGSLDALRNHLRLVHADVVRLAGGAKAIAAPAIPSERDVLLRQIEIAATLHEAKKVVLTTHEDCGACGGSAAFGNDSERERVAHSKWLEGARRMINAQFPNLEVLTSYLTFEGAEEL